MPNETLHTKCKDQTPMKTMKAWITHRGTSLSILVTPAHEKFSDSGAGHFLRPDFEGMQKTTGRSPPLYVD